MDGSQTLIKQFDIKMNELLSNDAEEEYFISCDEVNDTFDAMRLKENLLRAIYANYAYGFQKERHSKAEKFKFRREAKERSLQEKEELEADIDKAVAIDSCILGIEMHRSK